MKRGVCLSLVVLSGMMSLTARAEEGAPLCLDDKIQVTVLNATINFATLTACSMTAGSVVIDSQSGGRSTTGCLQGSSQPAFRGKFRVKGGQTNPASRIYVTVDDASIRVSDGRETMVVKDIAISPGRGAAAFLPGTQAQTYDVGAALSLPRRQASGSYTGTFTVTAECE